jgi:hypothetical protein
MEESLNDEVRMTKEARNPDDEMRSYFELPFSSFGIRHSFGIRTSTFELPSPDTASRASNTGQLSGGAVVAILVVSTIRIHAVRRASRCP